jgi:HD superfamily phosphohydrolase
MISGARERAPARRGEADLNVLRWNDRVYGDVQIDDTAILELIATPTFQRLGGIRQAGPSALSFPFKTVTRLEHCIGVYLLLGRLGANRRECVAGLLHDISHTAFSHAVDFIVDSEEQDHHEELKPEFLNRPDLREALAGLGFAPEEFYDDAIYPVLERPLPWLCADRVDYFLRDSLACNVSTHETVNSVLAHLDVIDDLLVLTDVTVARTVVRLFSVMNQYWWASPTEAYIYNEFADALREGLRLGVLDQRDLLSDDAQVLARLEAASSELIREKIEHVRNFDPERVKRFTPRVTPKSRWLDPPVVLVDGTWRLLSEIDPAIPNPVDL